MASLRVASITCLVKFVSSAHLCHLGGCLDTVPWLVPIELSATIAVVTLSSCLGVFVCAQRKGGASAWVEKAMSSITVSASHGSRVVYVDNCRFILMNLVIAGHFMRYFAHQKMPMVWWMEGFHGYFESYFMHFFALCSGLLSKGYLTPERAMRSIVRVLAPFLMMNYVFLPLLCGHEMSQMPNPYFAFGATWFLQAWLLWRACMPFLSTLHTPLMVFTAFSISWMAGYWYEEGAMLFHADAAFAYLGFYVTGYVLPLEWLSALDRQWVKLVGLLVTVVFISAHTLAAYNSQVDRATYRQAEHGLSNATHFVYTEHWDAWHVAASRHFYFKSGTVHRTSPATYWLAWTQRLSHQLLVCWPPGLAFMAMVPHSEQVFTEWGTRTMYPLIMQIFCFHFGQWLLRKTTGSVHLPAMGPVMWFSVMFIGANAINIACACRFTHSWARFILEPVWLRVLFKSDEDLKQLNLPSNKRMDVSKSGEPNPESPESQSASTLPLIAP